MEYDINQTIEYTIRNIENRIRKLPKWLNEDNASVSCLYESAGNYNKYKRE